MIPQLLEAGRDGWEQLALVTWRSLYKAPALPKGDADALETEVIKRLAKSFREWSKLRHERYMAELADLLTDVIGHHEIILCDKGQNDACDAARAILAKEKTA